MISSVDPHQSNGLSLRSLSAASTGFMTNILGHRLLLPVVLCILTLGCYLQVFSNGFIEAYDDEPYVTLNAAIADGFNVKSLRWSLQTFVGGNWNPLTWWSHMLDVELFGLNPVGHHATSLLFHVANTLLIYSLFVRLTGRRIHSFLVAALFSLHPLHVESVAWVAERKDVLSTFWGLSSLHAYVTWIRSRNIWIYAVLFFFFCLSLMAKPMLVTLPCLMLILDFWPLSRIRVQSLASLLIEKLPLLIPVVAISIVTVFAQQSQRALIPLSGNPLSERICVALDAYMVYLRKFVLPYDLAVFYPYTPPSFLQVSLATISLCIISIIVWCYRNNQPWLIAGWLWFLGMLAPVIGIVRVGMQEYADRYTYLPLVGVVVMVVWTAGSIYERVGMKCRVAAVVATFVLSLFSAMTWIQTGYWKDGFTLYKHTVEVTGKNWLAENNLGVMFVRRAQYNEGLAHYLMALKADPDCAEAHYNLGNIYAIGGDLLSAQEQFRMALRLKSDYQDCYIALARLLRGEGNLTGALHIIQDGERFLPDSPIMHANEALILARMGCIHDAVAAYRLTLSLEPGNCVVYVDLASLLLRHGRKSEAFEVVEQLKKIDPVAAINLWNELSNNS